MPTAGPDLIPGYNPSGPGGLSGAIIATRVATFFTQPAFGCAPPGDTSRLFVVERTGAIKIIDLTSGQVLATPFLNVSSQILTDGERGLIRTSPPMAISTSISAATPPTATRRSSAIRC